MTPRLIGTVIAMALDPEIEGVAADLKLLVNTATDNKDEWILVLEQIGVMASTIAAQLRKSGPQIVQAAALPLGAGLPPGLRIIDQSGRRR